MSWPASACMGMTPRYPSWPRAIRRQDGFGSMCAMIAPLTGGRRRRRSITPHGTEDKSILKRIFTTLPASCRRMPTRDTIAFLIPRDRKGRLPRHYVGLMPGEASSSLPILRPMPGGARRRQRSRPLRWRRSSVSMRCSTLSVASMAAVPKSAWLYGRRKARPWWQSCKHGCVRSDRACRAPRPSSSPSIIC